MPELADKDIIENFKRLDANRSNEKSHWEELYRYILPRKQDVLNTMPTSGVKKNTHLFDSTAIQSNEILAGALHGMLTNPNTQWFELLTGDPDLDQKNDNVRLWLQRTTDRIHNVLNNTNFQSEIHEVYLDLGAIGTAGLMAQPDRSRIIVFQTFPIREVVVDEDHYGFVNQVYRRFQWPALKMIQEFGEKNVPERVLKSWKQKDDQKFWIYHGIYPFNFFQKGAVKRAASHYVLEETETGKNHRLAMRGFRRFPFIVSRWSKLSGEIYGRGPGMTALPEAKILNKMDETVLKGAQKAVDPPVQAPDDGVVRPLKTRPGGTVYFRAGTTDRVEPIFNDTRIDFGFEAMADRRQRIRKAFFVDQLRLDDLSREATATEVLQRTEDAIRFLAPTMGRMRNEVLRPVVAITLDEMISRDMVDPIPPELEGRILDVQYSSMVAKAQRVGEIQNILRGFQAISPITQADPAAFDNIDTDQSVQKILRLAGFPQEMLRNAEGREAIRDARAEAEAQSTQGIERQQQVENLGKIAPVLKAIQPS